MKQNWKNKGLRVFALVCVLVLTMALGIPVFAEEVDPTALATDDEAERVESISLEGAEAEDAAPMEETTDLTSPEEDVALMETEKKCS